MPRYLIVTILLLSCSFNSIAQKDSVKTYYSKCTGLRTEIGWNKPWFVSLGFSYHLFVSVRDRGGMIASMLYYLSCDAHLGSTYNDGQQFYAYKTGAEFMVNGGVVAFEIKRLTDFTASTHTIFTPKFGYGLGFANLLYGYNVFTETKNIYRIGRHQLSLSFNLSPQMIREFRK